MGNRQSAITEPLEEESEGSPLSEIALRSEVGFWREMIQARSEALPAEAVERMHHALALAEHRLVELYEGHSVVASSQVIDFACAKNRDSRGRLGQADVRAGQAGPRRGS